ncbi:MAG TPA: ABC-2 family transporter protein, partial [Bacillota bacterium]|nr:ABC-2 family transporter protein [Bacillota bacterium]
LLGVKAPPDFEAGLTFLMSLFLGFIIAFALNSITIMLAFWTTNVHGAQLAKRALVEICSGVLIPFEFLPLWLKEIVNYLPFQGMAYIPISIYTGRITGTAIYCNLAAQLGWAVMILLIAQLIWNAASRQVTINGG